MKRAQSLAIVLFCVALLLVFCPNTARISAQDGEEARLELTILRLKHRGAAEIKMLLVPFAGKSATLEVDESGNQLIVRDTGENLKQIRELVQDLDRPGTPRAINFTFEVYKAGNQLPDADSPPVDSEHLELFKAMFNFKYYQLLSNTHLKGSENHKVEFATMDHQIRFLAGVSGGPSNKEMIRLRNIRINQQVGQSSFTLESDISAENNKLMIIGGSSLNSPNQAVIILLTATFER
ncbi:secretin N-terminal domain-containing protein [Planctomycetota bacterium]